MRAVFLFVLLYAAQAAAGECPPSVLLYTTEPAPPSTPTKMQAHLDMVAARTSASLGASAVIGDSLAMFWPKLELARALGADAVNLGLGYDEIQHVMWRVANHALPRMRPAPLVIEVGTNNLRPGVSACALIAGYRKLSEGIRSSLPHTKLPFLSVPYRGDDFTFVRSQIDELNGFLQEIAGHVNATYADSNVILACPALPCDSYTKDKLDFTPAEHARLSRYPQDLGAGPK